MGRRRRGAAGTDGPHAGRTGRAPAAGDHEVIICLSLFPFYHAHIDSLRLLCPAPLAGRE